MSSPGCSHDDVTVPEVEALRDTMNGNPEGGRKKIQRKAGGMKEGFNTETTGFMMILEVVD